MEDRFRSIFERHALGSIVDRTWALATPALRLVAIPAVNPLPVGASRIGGHPDLPPWLEWPAYQGEPMAFIAQFNLSEVPLEQGTPELLPRTGQLLFFYDSQRRPWGDQPSDLGGWRVIHIPPQASLEPRPMPAEVPAYSRFRAMQVTFQSEMSLPAWNELWTDDDWMENPAPIFAYQKALEDVAEAVSGQRSVFRVGGHPMLEQGAMQPECLRYIEAAAGRPAPGANGDLLLLFQVASDAECGMSWGDFGKLFFWIRRDHLEQQQFDWTWLYVQCG